MFVLVYDSYWEEGQSENMIYSSQCNKDENELLPIIPIPHQFDPPYSGFEVCAFGGKKGEIVCGKIVDSGVTVKVPEPGSNGLESVDFAKVVKVNMTDNYDPGYMGAPVYIPEQIPFSSKLIASPVGQVVETLDQYIGNSTEPNIWYYTPLNNILEYSGLKLLSSPPVTENEKSSSNQSDISWSDNSIMNSNTSEIIPNQLDKRQLFLLTQASQSIKLSSDSHQLRDNAKRCTLGFAVTRGGREPFDHGFLTLGSCMSTDRVGNVNGVFHIRPKQPLVPPVRIGTARIIESDLVYRRFFGLNFVPVRLLPNNPPHRVLWNDLFSTQLTIPFNPDNPAQAILANVIGNADLPIAGNQICATTGYSGIFCGIVTEPSAPRTMLNPWRIWAYIRQRVLGVDPMENWRNLIKVRVFGIPQAFTDRVISYDQGSPVYSVEQNGAPRAQPVGILLDYVEEEEFIEGHWTCVIYMYCISVEKILANDLNLRLIGTPHHQ